MKWIIPSDELPKNNSRVLFIRGSEETKDISYHLGFFIKDGFCGSLFCLPPHTVSFWALVDGPYTGKLPTIVGNEATQRITIDLIGKTEL